MAPRNGSGKARNKSRTRPATRGSPQATNNPPTTSLEEPTAPSMSCVTEVPISKQSNDHTQVKRKETIVSKQQPLLSDDKNNPIETPQTSTNDLVFMQDNSLVSDEDSVQESATHGLSDNRGSLDLGPQNVGEGLSSSSINADKAMDPPSPTDNSWQSFYSELKMIRSRMATLDEVEAKTSKFSQQIQAVIDRTDLLESKVDGNNSKTQNKIRTLESKVATLQDSLQKQNNSATVRRLEEELTSLRDTVKKQGEMIAGAQKLKEDFSKASKGIMAEMNDLVETQRGQVESFNNSTRAIKQEVKEVKEETKETVSQLSANVAYDKLRDQAFKKRHNLVIIGLKESDTHSSYSVAKTFFKDEMKAGKVDIDDAYRIGPVHTSDNPYIRPLLVRFDRLSDRNAIWKKRNKVPNKEGEPKIKIQADLPKQLRADIQLLYRIVRVASNIPEYKNTSVRNYALLFKGKEYTAQQLEKLPACLQPSSIAETKSDQVYTFFSKYSPLSNHHPSQFIIDDHTFHSVEQFLAYKRAVISDDNSIVQRALESTDPIEAKGILNSLKRNHIQEWEDNRGKIAEEGLRAKFSQNEHLRDFLLSTGNRQLGEASHDKTWGVGMALDNKDVLDTSQWPDPGNLLGNILMKIRDDLHTQ